MRIFPDQYNGFLFSQGPKEKPRVVGEFDDYDWDIGGISTITAQRQNKRPKYAGVNYTGAVKVVHLTLNDPDHDRDNLIIAMDVGGDEQHELYALDELGRRWYVMAKCVGLTVEDTDGIAAKYGYIFEVDDPTWILVSETSNTWDVVADEDTNTITVIGNQPTFPTFELTPGPPVGYYPNIEYIKNYNPIGLQQIDGIDITGGGWDTASLVTGGKMLASGNDVRVIFDGEEYPFWVGGGGWDNAATKIWIRASWLPGQSFPLRTALDNSTTPALIQFKKNKTVKKALKKLPLKGIVLIGSEEISYENLDAVNCQASIVERNIRGTSIAAHSAGDSCIWVEHDIRIIYGNSSATAPDYDTTYKPVFDLTNSTNASRVYADFADAKNLRAGSFVRQILNFGLGKKSRVYSGNNGSAVEVDPATDMGMELASYQVQGKVKPETAELAWMYYHPAIITTVTTTGDKFKAFSNSSWPSKAALQSSVDGVTWVTEWNEATPGSAGSFGSITNTGAETLAANSKYFRYILSGSINAVLDNLDRLEINAVTLALNSSNIIQIAMRGEDSSYQFNVEIRNNTNGQSLFINYPVKGSAYMDQAGTIIIDCDLMTATYKGINAIRGVSWDSIRTDWFRLEPGVNELQFFADPTNSVTIVTKYHSRAL